MSKLIKILIIVLFLPCIQVSAQDNTFEPTDSWVYNSLDLLNHYKPPSYYLNQRPYSRQDIIKYFNNFSFSNLTPSIAYWEIRRIFKENRRYPNTDRVFPTTLKITPYSMNYFEDNERPLFRVGFKSEFTLNFNRRIFVQFRGRLENKGQLDSFAKVRRWKDKFTGYLDYALIGYDYNGVRFTLGRTFRTFGPHDNDRLLISANSPAFDQLSLDFKHTLVAFQYWTARLDNFYDTDDEIINRYYAAHRLVFKPYKRLEIGFSETVLYGRKNSGWELYYLNPILPFYWEQYNNRKDDNIYMGMDFTWFPMTGLKLYGELLADDFQIDFHSEQHQLGFNLGFSELGMILSDRLQIKADYTQIRNTVYGQNKFYNVYANHGVVIGSSLGTDSDRWRYSLTYHATPFLRATLGGRMERKGEGRYDDPQTQAVPEDPKFPTGTVQKKTDSFVRVDLLYSNKWEGYFQAGYLDIKNYENKETDYHSWYFSLNLQFHIKFRKYFH